MIHYIHLETVDSTNNWVKKHASELQDFTCVTAQEQTAGRGRFERKWLSPKGNLYATLFFHVPEDYPYLANIGQMMAQACAKLLQQHGFKASIKWPNDILVGRHKIAGILTETFPQQGKTAVILGVGLNVNMDKKILETVDQPATSLLELSGKPWEIQSLLNSLFNEFVYKLNLDFIKQLQ